MGGGYQIFYRQIGKSMMSKDVWLLPLPSPTSKAMCTFFHRKDLS